MDNMNGFPIFISLICFIIFIFMLLKKSKTRVPITKLPPGPSKLPIIGNMLQLLGSLPHHRLRDLAIKYGPIMHLQLGEVSNIIISSPEAAKEVVKTHDISFAQRPPLLAARIILYDFKDIGFGTYDDSWKQLRKICTLELLSAKRVQSFRSIREEEVSHVVNLISSNPGSTVNLSKMVFALSKTITLRTAFGKIGKQKDELFSLVGDISQAFGGFSLADTFPSIKIFQWITGARARFERLHRETDRILENIMEHYRASKADSKGKADVLVGILLDLYDHGDPNFDFTMDNVKAVMLDIFLAGTETTSTTVEWAMSEMIKNPRVMEKAQAEVRQLFNQTQQVVDEATLPELTYLKLVIKETLRLHPALPLLVPRECREMVEISGYEIPIKTRVIINAWAIARDPRYWNDAEKFYPERFLETCVDFRGSDMEFVPFGSGRRMCPGVSYAISVVELTLANLLYHFDWKVSNGMKSDDLDMTECFGSGVRRKHNLCLIPTAYSPYSAMG